MLDIGIGIGIGVAIDLSISITTAIPTPRRSRLIPEIVELRLPPRRAVGSPNEIRHLHG